MFDERNRVIFDPKKKSQYELTISTEHLLDCNVVTKKIGFIGAANAYERKKIYPTRFSRR